MNPLEVAFQSFDCLVRQCNLVELGQLASEEIDLLRRKFRLVADPRVLGGEFTPRPVRRFIFRKRPTGSAKQIEQVELADGADPQALLHRIIDTGANISRFEIVRPSLHQIFLERVGARGIEMGMSGHG